MKQFQDAASADTAYLDARDPVFCADPHAVLDAVRSRAPALQEHALDRVVLTGADDVGAAFVDRSLSSNPLNARPNAFAKLGFTEDDRANPALLFLDDPEHARLRKPLVQVLNARAVNAVRPRIEKIVARLLDAIPAGSSFELISAYASPAFVQIVASLLGIDEADANRFRRLSYDFTMRVAGGLTDHEKRRVEAANRELTEYLTDIIERRRSNPRGDLISELLSVEINGERLATNEVLSLSRSMFVAGTIPTTTAMGNGVVALLRNPEQLKRLRAGPDRWAAAIEEMLRYDPPTFMMQRSAIGEREIRGCPVAQGQTVALHLLGANHDPVLHTNPHDFDIERKEQKHFSFGGGAHFCPGASLARMELQIALRTLLDRFPHLHLAPDRELRRKVHPLFNGYEAVWLDAA